jgi:hypothetical protein
MDHTAAREGPRSFRISPIPSIPCAPSWVSKTPSNILVLKYHGALHRYIQTEMDFLDISSLGAAYRYAVKIEQKFKHQNKQEFKSANTQQPKYDKDGPNIQSPEIQSKTQ